MSQQRSLRRWFRSFWGWNPTPCKVVRRRQPRLEALESRQLLSVTLPTLLPQTVAAGAPLNLALNGSASTGNALTYTVSVSNAQLTNPTLTDPQLSAIVPQGNPSLRLTIDDAVDQIHGDMVLQLFQDLAPETVAKITGLANQGYYNGLIFHRVIENFMIQGGDPNGTGTGGPGFQFDSEIDASLQFTSAGVLAMANSGTDTNGSQFFITTVPTRWLDFRYTIFGYLTQGGDILNSIEGVATDTNDKPINTVTMTSVSVFTDTQNGVLRLSAPNGTTGTASVTVTATDNVTGESASQTFQVTVQADTSIAPPFLQTIAPIQTTVDTPVTFTIPVTNVDGVSVVYSGSVQSGSGTVALAVDSTTGQATLTPSGGVSGVFSVKFEVAAASGSGASSSTTDSQIVPVYVAPAAPGSVVLVSTSDTGGSDSDLLTNLDNTAGKALQFQVDGVVAGATVELLADGALIGEIVAASTSVVITTDATVALTDGAHAITARQTLKDQAVNAGNLSTTTDLASAASTALTLTVDTAAPQFDFEPVASATTGTLYSCQVATSSELAGTVIYQLNQAPSGMSIDASGLITWTPGTDQAGVTNVIVQAMDAAGNTAAREFSIHVVLPNTAPLLTPAAPVLGTIHLNTPLTISLTGTFLNNGANTTTITDADAGAVVGGIAVTGVTGSGTWQYSIDGNTFQAVSSVGEASALLLARDAELRYVPDSQTGETATLTYRAWDTASGVSGARANLSASAAVGGSTAFSEASDTASLTVTSITDATLLAPAQPRLGSTSSSAAKTVALTGSFINNGEGTTTITTSNTGGVAGGIALTGLTGSGTWEFSSDGTTFQSIESVSDASVLLLSADTQLRYTPSGQTSETAGITYRAWDATSGASGGRADLSAADSVGGSTAFSLFSDTATLAINDAPVLTAAGPSLGSTTEDTPLTVLLTGTFINFGSGTTTITDPDSSAVVGGIALIGVTGSGTWEYSLDGATFTAVGAVTDASALLLPGNASLRYTPGGSYSETPTITYRAWDTTSGTSGEKVDATTNGDVSAFSSATDTAWLTVTAANTAPVLAPAGPSLGTTSPGGTQTISLLGTFINDGAGTTTITDTDSSAIVGGIALIGVTGSGTWEYSLDGVTYTAVGAVSGTSGLLLPYYASLRYTAAAAEEGGAAITYRAWDMSDGESGATADTTANGGATAFSSATDTATLAIGGCSLSGFVYLDNNNDGSRMTSSGTPHLGLANVVLRLYSMDSLGSSSEVEGKSPVVTGADGSYRITGLPAGIYWLQQTQPSNFVDGKETVGKVGGVATGTAAQNYFMVELEAGDSGVEYNFGERGLRAGLLSLRFFLASSPPLAQILQSYIPAPSAEVLASATALASRGGSAAALASTAAPARLALSQWSVAENQPVGTVVGQLSMLDESDADMFVYSLVEGTGSDDNASFAIEGNQLLTATVFTFPTKSAYSVRVRGTGEGGLFTEQAFVILATSYKPVT